MNWFSPIKKEFKPIKQKITQKGAVFAVVSEGEITKIFMKQNIISILKTLSEGKQMKISNFGTFKLRKKEERVGRNPKTMQEFKISARKVVTFKPSSLLIKKINR